MPTVFGKNAVLDTLKSTQSIDRVMIQHDKKHTPDMKEIMQVAKTRNIKVQFLAPKLFKKSYEHAQGVAAITREASGKSVSLDKLIDSPETFPMVVVLDHLEDSYNVGAILRTCETLGVQTVIYPKDRHCQIGPGVTKVASGAVSYLNLMKVTNIATTIQALKKAGYWIYGADSNNGVPLPSFSPAKPFVLVIGNESKGISSRVKTLLDEALHIPMCGKISSMNVSVATGITLYHLTQ